MKVTKKKILTIIRCLEKWDAESQNVKFEIRIDHKNWEYFMTVKKLTNGKTNGLRFYLNTISLSIISRVKTMNEPMFFRNGNKMYRKQVMINWNIK